MVSTDQSGQGGSTARTTKASLEAQGESALARALQSLGHEVTKPSEGSAADLVVSVDGIEVPVEITAVSVVNPETVRQMVGGAP